MYLRDGSAQTILRAATLREVADQTFYLTQSQYTDTGPTSPSTDPITPGAWQGSAATGVPIFKSLVGLDPEKIPAQAGFEPGIFRSRGGRLTTRPTRRSPPAGGDNDTDNDNLETQAGTGRQRDRERLRKKQRRK